MRATNDDRFETDRLPNGWELRLNAMDEIWVPTKWAATVFAAGGVEPSKLVVVAEPVDTRWFDPASVEPLPLNVHAAGSTVFLSVFKWEERKGWRVLLEAYFAEFTALDNVLLVILTNAYHSDANFEEQVEDFAQRLGRDRAVLPPVQVMEKLSDAGLRSLYKSADCFVLPSRGEGWGRPHVEAMSMGLPIIATNWSGPTEFLTEQNGFPLAIDGLSAIADGPFQGHLWADPSVSHLRQLLRGVFEDPTAAAAKGTRARLDMIERFSPEVLSAMVAAHMRRIESKLGHAGAGGEL